ncbi:MAG: hypothetical protein FWG91_03805 [Lachnospiraceae bacterium]|nr:hypothetical protein [Lachnospiraceae bacterium]
MNKMTGIEKHEKNTRAAILACSLAALLVIGGLIWQFGPSGLSGDGPAGPPAPGVYGEAGTLKPEAPGEAISGAAIPPEAKPEPIAFETPPPYVPAGDEGGAPLTGHGEAAGESIAGSPGEAAEEMVKAAEGILADEGIAMGEAKPEDIEKAVEAANEKGQPGNGGNGAPKNGDTKTEDGKEYFFAFGEWHERIRGEGGVIGSNTELSGNKIGY